MEESQREYSRQGISISKGLVGGWRKAHLSHGGKTSVAGACRRGENLMPTSGCDTNRK